MSENAKYHAQTAWSKRNGYGPFTFKTYRYIGDAIRSMASQRGISIAKLVIDAIEGYYGVSLRKSQNESANSDEEE